MAEFKPLSDKDSADLKSAMPFFPLGTMDQARQGEGLVVSLRKEEAAALE